MDKFPQMLYRVGAQVALHDLGLFDTLVVADDDELVAAREEGWADTTTEAVELSKPKEPVAEDQPPTAEELAERERQLANTKPKGKGKE